MAGEREEEAKVSMMASRLTRLAPGLTAKQRAMMTVRAYVSDAPQDPDIGRSMPAEQREEYDYYIALLYTANSPLAVLSRALAGMVDALTYDREHLSVLGEAASMLEETCGDEAKAKSVRGWRKRQNVTVPEFLRGLEHEVRQSLLEQTLLFWRQLRALEVLWAEIFEQVDGEDLRHPDIVDQATATRTKLLALMAELAPRPSKSPPEPDEELVAGLRTHVEEAMRLMGYRENGQ